MVLNWNAWSDTIACVESLLASHRVPDQIVICDNGSRDDSVGRLRLWGHNHGGFTNFWDPDEAFNHPGRPSPIVLIALPKNGGYAYGNNIGIRYGIDRSNADYVWILNNDTVVARDALERMIEVAEADPAVGLVGSKLLRHDEPDTIQALGGGFILPVLCHDTQLGSGQKSVTGGDAPIPLDHIVGASLLVRAEAVENVGLIDESYFLYREETDWCIRMRRRGWKLYCCTQATVWHKQSHSIGFKSPLHDYYAVRNMLRLIWKFYPLAAPAAFGYFALRSITPKLLRFEVVRLAAVLLAFSDFFSGKAGRSSEHTDQMLVTSYVAGTAKPMHWWPSLRTAEVALTILALIFALGSGRVSQLAPGFHRPVAVHKSARSTAHARIHTLTRGDARIRAKLSSAVSLR